MSRPITHRVPALLVALMVACTPAPDSARRPATIASVPTPAPLPAALSVPFAGPASPDSVTRPASVPRGDASLFHPGDISPEARATCDSAVTLTRAAIGLTMHREEGNYFDHSHGISRTGCWLTAAGSFKALPKNAMPVDELVKSFARRGWRPDLRYDSAGPDGSSMGMRFRSMFCLVRGSWDGGDDSEPDSVRARADPDPSYEAMIECARDVPSNEDTGVPDAIWRIARAAGLDGVYAISLRMQYPTISTGWMHGMSFRVARPCT